MAVKKVVLITGVTSGIGRATALALARQGVNVVGIARRRARLKELIKEMEPLPGEFLPWEGDVTNIEDIEEIIQEIMAKFGHLDAVVANAGVGHRGAIVESNWKDIEALLRTNIDGVLHTIRASVPVMRIGTEPKTIVIVSSVVYNMVSPYAAIYAASKAFVSSIAASLRLELEDDNISVVDILVGRTSTEFDENRLGKGKRASNTIPEMPPAKVADAITAAIMGRPRRRFTIRAIDQLIVVANRLMPDIIGRRVKRMYR